MKETRTEICKEESKDINRSDFFFKWAINEAGKKRKAISDDEDQRERETERERLNSLWPGFAKKKDGNSY